jgi:hypothetical protein
MSLSKQLENIEALDPEGRPVRLGEFWQERPVLLTVSLGGWLNPGRSQARRRR